MCNNNYTVEVQRTRVIIKSLEWLHCVWPVIPYHYREHCHICIVSIIKVNLRAFSAFINSNNIVFFVKLNSVSKHLHSKKHKNSYYNRKQY
jgi:hypothetical protein